MASNSHVNSPIGPKIELIKDFKAVLITGKSEENLSKMKLLLSRQHFMKFTGPSRVGNSHANSRNWAKIELVRDFMPVLVI